MREEQASKYELELELKLKFVPRVRVDVSPPEPPEPHVPTSDTNTGTSVPGVSQITRLLPIAIESIWDSALPSFLPFVRSFVLSFRAHLTVQVNKNGLGR